MFTLGILISTASEVRYPLSNSESVDSPSDRIMEGDIHVFSDRAVIDQENLIWAKIKDTHSMEPVLNAGSISLELPPVASDIKVGDIISFQEGNRVIIHRVILIGQDPEGLFFVTKGDNNPEPDPYKVRFDSIKGIVVGILY